MNNLKIKWKKSIYKSDKINKSGRNKLKEVQNVQQKLHNIIRKIKKYCIIENIYHS